MAQSIEIYNESYEAIKKLIKANTTDNLTIDFSKLDTETAGELRGAIDNALFHRKREVEYIIFHKPQTPY